MLYYRKYRHVIINPQWVINAFRVILTDDRLLPTDDVILSADLINYTENAVLTTNFAKALFQKNEDKSFLQHVEIVFAFLEEFGLLVKAFLGQDQYGQPRYDRNYTVPSKLRHAPPLMEISSMLTAKGVVVSRTLCIVFENVFIPQELFDRIYAGIIKTFKPMESMLLQEEEQVAAESFVILNHSSNHVYKGIGCFHVDDLYDMIVHMQWEESTITVTLFSTSEPGIPDGTGAAVRQKLDGVIEHTLEVSRQKHLVCTYKLHCGFQLKANDKPRDRDGILRSARGLPCQSKGCCGGHILTKHDWHVWFPDTVVCTVSNVARI